MKKHRILMVLMAFLIMAGQSLNAQSITFADTWADPGLSIQQESGSGVVLNYSLSGFTMLDIDIDGSVSKTVKIPEVFLPNDAGAPDLPGIGKFIAIPRGAHAVLSILSVRKEVYQNIDIAPAPVIPIDSDPTPMVYNKDQKIYSSNQYYPAKPVILSEQVKMRGLDGVMLGITPFQYNPVTKELVVYRDLVVQVEFVGGNGQFGDPRLRSRWWDPILYSNTVNAGSIPEMDYNTIASPSDAEVYDYVIITPDHTDFINKANEIKDFRTKQGIKTAVVTTTDIGGNTVSAIEAYIDNAYNTWQPAISAVLLLGDYSDGTSDGITSQWYDHPAGYPDFVSDNKFADVDEDNLPDVILARITARNATELDVMVSKFIDYETNPPAAANFYDQPITALGWQTERWFQICSEVVGGYLSNVKGKHPVRINEIYSGTPSTTWSTAPNTSSVVDYFGPNGLGYIPSTPDQLGNWSGGSASDVINAINSGAFLLQHRDHGYYGGWGEPAFSTSHIPSLTNTNNELPFIFSINCQTGAFHRSTETFAEMFHRHTYNGQNAGALGIIAATEVSYSFVNDTYVWGVMDNLFPDFMPDKTAEFPVNFVMPAFGNAAGKHFLYQSAWPYNTSDKLITYRLFHHHGDAYLNLYTEVPQALTVSHPATILNAETSVDVTANDGSFIALSANGVLLGTADGTGSAVSVSIPVQAAGTIIDVVVTMQNYYRHESTINVTAGGILADFSANMQDICAGETITFTDQSTGNITSYNWDFGAEATPSTYTGAGPVDVTFNTAGTYDISLTVSDGSNNDTELKTAYISVGALNADFSASSLTVAVGGYITYTNLSNCATSYNWVFNGGDPSGSTAENPAAVQYNTVGTYTTSLTADNGSSTDYKELTIEVLDISYCTSYGNPATEWIQSINFAGQENVSGQSQSGYEDFTHQTISLDPGSSNTVILVPGFGGRSTFEYWNVWIDYNADGDFADAGELVLSLPKKKSTITATLSIPGTASGTTVMRISMKRGVLPGYCETGFYGEVEDYTVSFAPVVPQPPVADFVADNQNISIGGTVNFTDQSLNDPTSWLWSFPGGSPATSTDQNPSVSYATAGTYDVSLTATNAQGSDAITKSGYITVTEGSTVSYCTVWADNSADHIVSVQIGSAVSNSGTTGTNGYNYFTTPFSLIPGSTYNVTLTPFNDRNRNFWRIWVDFNNDGDFDDTDETLLVANNKKGVVNSSITIPTGVEALSPDRMRIILKTGGSPTACESGFGGEIEDYDVTYGAEFFTPESSSNMNISLYPNPAKDVLNIFLEGNREQVNVNIYNATGELMDTFKMSQGMEHIDLGAYHSGIYFMHINDGMESILQKFIVN